VTVLTPKALRHTAATLMVANGAPLHAVKNGLGHANIQLTANLYSHATPEASRQAVAELARVLNE
jgi:integrase